MTGSAQRSPTGSLRIPTNGPFSLKELATFGFGHQDASAFDGVMRMAFCVDGDQDAHAGVEVRQDGEELELVVHGHDDIATVARQVARILSCDHDGRSFVDLGRKDPVIGALQAAAPGLRPPLFHSPYEAALWSIISMRRPRAQAMVLRDRLARAHGTTFLLAGVEVAAVPGPGGLAGVGEIQGLPDDRIGRLQALAAAAQRGELAVEHLNALSPEDAMAELQRLPGIGPFSSALIVVRACGLVDVLPAEAGARELAAVLYDTGPLDDAGYQALAESWRPFRTWAVVMIRAVAWRVLPPERLPALERKRRATKARR